jgi:hypothetical protein
VRVKRVKRMSAAPKKAAGTRAKKARSASWIVGPVPIMFAAACVVAFVGAVALNPVSNSPRKPDVAIAAPRAEAVAKKATAPAETPALPAATLTAPAAQVASVTITGCLEHDDETFWLSDPSGTDAPTSRSWKSGFLKKRPSRIELVDSEHALRLTSYVGHRVSATGTLVNREMQTRSLHPLSATCS